MAAQRAKLALKTAGPTFDIAAASLKPRSRRFREYLLEDMNKRGLLEALEGIGESVSVASDEGETVLRSPLFCRDLATLNKVFDGDCSCGMSRGKGDTVYALESSVNCLVMAQPEVAIEFREKFGSHARAIGFDARCLYACIPLVNPEPHLSCAQLAICLSDYLARSKDHLSARTSQLDSGETHRTEMRLSDEAEALWWRLLKEHKQCGERGFEHVRDAFNRTPQQALRIAGNLHAYGNWSKAIPAKTLKAGWLIARWFLAEFAFAFPPERPALPVAPRSPKPSLRDKQLQRQQDDLRTVIDCIRLLCQQLGVESVPREKVRIRCGLYSARYLTAEMRAIDEGKVIENRFRKQTHLALAPGA